MSAGKKQIEKLLGVEIALEWKKDPQTDYWTAAYETYSLDIHKPAKFFRWEICRRGSPRVILSGETFTSRQSKTAAQQYLAGLIV